MMTDMRELYTKSKRHLLINTERLERVLEEAFTTLDAQESKLNGHELTIAEHYFDQQVLLYLQKKETNKSEFLEHLKQRLDLKFYIFSKQKQVNTIYESFRQKFIEDLLPNPPSLPRTEDTLVKRFQKLWENKIINSIRTGEKELRTETISYWYNYHFQLPAVQRKLEAYHRTWQVGAKASFRDPLIQAFKELLTNIKRDPTFLKENSDAFIIKRLEYRIIDSMQRNRKITQGENSIDPSTTEQYVDYREVINEAIGTQFDEYLPLLRRIIDNLGEPCYSFLKDLLKGIKKTVIAEKNGYARAYATNLNKKCLKELRSQILK